MQFCFERLVRGVWDLVRKKQIPSDAVKTNIKQADCAILSTYGLLQYPITGCVPERLLKSSVVLLKPR